MESANMYFYNLLVNNQFMLKSLFISHSQLNTRWKILLAFQTDCCTEVNRIPWKTNGGIFLESPFFVCLLITRQVYLIFCSSRSNNSEWWSKDWSFVSLIVVIFSHYLYTRYIWYLYMYIGNGWTSGLHFTKELSTKS